MNKSFLALNAPPSTVPNLVNIPGLVPPGRVPLRILVISIPAAVNNTIYTLHHLGFADVSQWSRLLPAPNHPGEVMSILTRYWVANN
ncbi:hypothetical protein [Microseira wollei]|uniref:Uncharacterized protein n=1 Tax=Microseira wollei NIES-4236 TaxID=2530354 RepID=A0AAV3XRA7_9CYAN|nr:hypothetical protein [Microseira wollei]GET44191.1 hypothetical protein MiSe_90170 [Microseira wollei NIES-4236]